MQEKPGDLAGKRGAYADRELNRLEEAKGDAKANLARAKDTKEAYDQAREMLKQRRTFEVQAGKLGVDLSLQTNNLRNQSRLEATALRQVARRNCIEIGGVWIDEGYEAKMTMVTVKAMSDAYFRMLERKPQMKEVFQLGNHLLWVTPSGTALVIDTSDGKEKMTDEEIDKLFEVKK